MSKTFYEFADKLIRSLDSRYNVIDMPTVLECISYFERANVTKIFLEETRVGKYVNELRRSTTDESLAKRTRELVRKWRHQLIPEQSAATNVVSSSSSVTKSQHADQNNLKVTIVNNNNNSYCINNNKRLLNDEKQYDVKRIKRNGEYKAVSPEVILIDNLSPNLNTTMTVPPVSSTLTSTATISTETAGITCLPVSTISPSMHEDSLITPAVSTVTNLTPPVPLSETATAPVSAAVPANGSDALSIVDDGCNNNNSKDSSSGNVAVVEPVEVITIEEEREQKRNRRRNTRNRAKAIKEVEASFTNKLVAMSRCKVKTTQEILDDLQNRSQAQNQNTNLKEIKKLDPPVAIAKLTEEIKKIDAKLKPAIQTSVNEIHRWRSNKNGPPTVIEIDTEDEGGDDDVVLLEPLPPQPEPLVIDPQKLLDALPSIDWDQFNRDIQEDKLYECNCPVESEDSSDTSTMDECPVKQFLMKKYNFPYDVTNKKLETLHYENVENLNGNMGRPVPPIDYYPTRIEETDIYFKYGLYTNIVPDVYRDVIPKRFTNHDQAKPLSNSDNDIEMPPSNVKNSSVPLLKTTPLPEAVCVTSNPLAQLTHSKFNESANSNLLIVPEISETTTSQPISANLSPILPSLPANSDSNNFEFIEWHKCYEVPSSNQEFIRILPYVIID